MWDLQLLSIMVVLFTVKYIVLLNLLRFWVCFSDMEFYSGQLIFWEVVFASPPPLSLSLWGWSSCYYLKSDFLDTFWQLNSNIYPFLWFKSCIQCGFLLDWLACCPVWLVQHQPSAECGENISTFKSRQGLNVKTRIWCSG